MARGDRRKCKCCLKLFRPDPRNRRHQRYCSTPACRRASKAASQERWLAKPENHDYFRGPVHVARVRRWRSGKPWVLAQGATSRPCATRCLNGTSRWFCCRNGRFRALTVTRCHIGATCCFDWLNRSYRRDTVTRGHRPHHRPIATTGARYSGPLSEPAVVIDYETFCKIRDCHDRQGLTIAQTARVLGLHPQTVAKWLRRSRFEPRRSRPRSSVLDPFKGRITRLCSIAILTARSRSFSVCAKRDTSAASPSCAITSAASGPPNCLSISSCISRRASVRRSTGDALAPSR